jgi:hypothetical protein
VTYTPIRDEALSSHLNFRDPDGIALEFTAHQPGYAAALAEMTAREVSYEEMLAIAGQLLPAEIAFRPDRAPGSPAS